MKNTILIASILFSHFIVAQPVDKLELLDIFNLEYVSDPQISPDGKKITYVRNFKDIMTNRNLSNLWITDFDGSNNRPITQGNQNDFYPRWSSDSKRIIFKSNRDGSTQLYAGWLDTGIDAKLTNTKLKIDQAVWSPDNSQLAFTMFTPITKESIIKMPKKPEGAEWTEPPVYIDDLVFKFDGQGFLKNGYDQIYTLPIDGGTPRQVTFAEFNNGTPAWTANGRNLIFSSNRNKDKDTDPLNTDLYKVNLNSLQTTQITDRKGPENNPAVSPDGKSIAFTGFEDRKQGYQLTHLFSCDMDGGNFKQISKGFDRSVQGIDWAADGQSVYFQYDDRGDTKIATLSLGGSVRDLTSNLGGTSLGRPYAGGSFSVSNSGRLAYTLSTRSGPAELGTSDRGKLKQLTDVNADLFDYKQPSPIEEITYKSSFDQRDIQGWVVKPPDFDPAKKYPLILEIHGGPFANYGTRYAAEIQLYAAAGYVVVYINPRGSTSYGEAFGNLIHHNYPGEDYDDLMSGVDHVISQGYVDADRLFVTGGSGGGVLSAWIVGKTNRFRAAVVAKPVINWYSFALYADISVYVSRYWFPGLPWDHQEAYMKRSPISLVKNVRTPTMLLTGEVDYRTPMAETEQYYGALKMLGVETAMVRIPEASHGIAAKPSNLVAKIAAVLAWFEKYDIQE